MRTSAKGEGVDQMRTPASRGIEVGKGVFLRTFFMDDSIISSLCGGRPVWVESAVFWRMPAIFVEREARKGVVHKGRPHREGGIGQIQAHVDRSRGKDLADVRKLVLFLSLCFANALYALLSILLSYMYMSFIKCTFCKLLFIPSLFPTN